MCPTERAWTPDRVVRLVAAVGMIAVACAMALAVLILA
jgi:hypothetical protein